MAKWQALSRGESQIDWTDGASTAKFDPYLAWLETINFAARDGDPNGLLPVAIELKSGGGPLLQALHDQWLLWVPPVWRKAGKGLRFCTAFVAPKSLSALKNLPIVRIEQGLVCRTRPTLGAAAASVMPPAIGLSPSPPPPPAPAGTPPARNVMAIVDDGCAFAHPSFRKPGQPPATRVCRLWDQGRVGATAPWRIPADFGYGMELSDDAGGGLQAFMGGLATADTATTERACYRQAGIPLPPVGPVGVWHGTHVMDLACGFPDPLAPIAPPPARDAAANADILFVQLPREAIPDRGGGWLVVHVLDALRYVLQHTHPRDNVVVNLSLGAQAGPHDGSSLLERAIDDLIQRERKHNFAVVVAAGNSYDNESHAEVSLAAGLAETLNWAIAPNDATDSCLEVWLPRTDAAGGAVNVEIQVTPQSGVASGFQRLGSALRYCGGPSEDKPVAMFLYARPPCDATGSTGTLALVTVAPTAAVAEYPLAAAPGNWRIEFRNKGSAPVDLHAWIEGDANARGFGGKPSILLNHVKSTCTLASLAGGQHTIVVGGFTLGSGSPPAYAEFSSSGPSRDGAARPGPDVAAPADRFDHGSPNQAVPLEAAGPLSDQPAWLAGTSMAAPGVARRVMNILATRKGNLTRDQIVVKLQSVAAPEPATKLARPHDAGQTTPVLTPRGVPI